MQNFADSMYTLCASLPIILPYWVCIHKCKHIKILRTHWGSFFPVLNISLKMWTHQNTKETWRNGMDTNSFHNSKTVKRMQEGIMLWWKAIMFFKFAFISQQFYFPSDMLEAFLFPRPFFSMRNPAIYTENYVLNNIFI